MIAAVSSSGSSAAAASSQTSKAPSDKNLQNDFLTKLYAGLICVVIAVFILAKWIGFVSRKVRQSKSTWASRIIAFPRLVLISRQVQKITIRSCPGFPSVGHAILVSTYVIVNTVLSFVKLDYSKVNYYAARFGWMAVANFAFIVILALKNTPLAFLTAYSYERLNYLHRVAGYTTVMYMVLHMATYIQSEVSGGKGSKLIETSNVMGMIAGSAMFIILLTTLFVMRHRYELFYVTHIVMAIIAIITTGLHRPAWTQNVPIVMAFIAGAWTLDRLIRVARTLAHSINNEARLQVLPNGGTKILLKKPLMGASSGSHCFLWIPRIRLLESHPFTIVSNGPAGLELVARAHDGFTRTLHEFAQRSNSESHRLFASADGPYGTFPEPTTYDRVILIVGGSGGTFAFGLVQDILQKKESEVMPLIDIVWAVKKAENITWFTDHLNTLRSHAPRVAMRLFITSSLRPIPQASDSDKEVHKSSEDFITDLSVFAEQSDTQAGFNEKGESIIIQSHSDNTSSQHNNRTWTVKYDKLRLETEIIDLLATTGKDQHVLITVCGPSGMAKASRKIIAQSIGTDGPSIDLHCESFGW